MISLYHLLKCSKKKKRCQVLFFWASKKLAKAKIALAGGTVAREKFIIDREQLKSGVNRRAR